MAWTFSRMDYLCWTKPLFLDNGCLWLGILSYLRTYTICYKMYIYTFCIYLGLQFWLFLLTFSILPGFKHYSLHSDCPWNSVWNSICWDHFISHQEKKPEYTFLLGLFWVVYPVFLKTFSLQPQFSWTQNIKITHKSPLWIPKAREISLSKIIQYWSH